MNKRKVVKMLLTPDNQTWQQRLLLLCDDGTIWTEAGEGKWDTLPLPPGCETAQTLDGET